MIKVVSVRFKSGGKPYYFAPGKDEYTKGMGVIVETAKGLEYATVVEPECEVPEESVVPPLKPVIRVATERDEEQVRRNKERRREAIRTAQEKIAARGLEMKVVECEFAFDGSKVVFYFTAESRVDFRELIKDLSSAFHMRIELRQINIRDEIKITGGLGPCGRECCCVGCMAEPKKVSVKMAKNQGLSLNPSKISGMCGRLMCCLSYENDYYAEACKQVPKIGSEAETPDGKGTVVNVNMLKMLVKVKIEQNDSVSFHEYPVDGIRFMRGNVVMGKEDLGAEEDETPEAEPASEEKTEQPPRENRQENRPDNRQGSRRDNRENRKGGNKEKRDNRDNRENRNNGNNGNNGNGGNKNKHNNRGNNDRGQKPQREGDRREGKPSENPANGGAPAASGDNRPNRTGGNFRRGKRGGKQKGGGNRPAPTEN